MVRTSPGAESASSGVFERLARDAQDCSTLQEFRTRLARAVQREVGADSASLTDAPGAPATGEAARGRSGWIGIPAAYVTPYSVHKGRYDGSIPRLVLAMGRGPVIDTEVYASSERERLALYAEILLPQRARSILCATVRYQGSPIGQIVLKRHRGVTPFRSDDVEALRTMLPALALADAGFQFFSSARTVSAPRAQLPRLTPRERQVAELACKGMHNREIALLLGTSAETVKKQIRSVLEKLGASNRTELATLWAEESRMRR